MGRKHLTRDEFAQHETRARRLRKAMVNHMRAVPADDVAVFMSSGVDSHACLFAALEAGKTVTCYSFSFRDKPSTDFRVARTTARQFGLRFVPVELPRDITKLKRHVLDVFHKYADPIDVHVNKSSVECTWPLFTAMHAIQRGGHGASVLGFGGDAFFCTLRSQKKRLIAGTYEEWKQEYFKTCVTDYREVQTLLLDEWCRQHNPGHRIVTPFHSKPVFDTFKGMHPFDPGCRPIQKAPVRLAFWDQMFRTDVLVHQSFQKGDSGISKHFETLLQTDWNHRGAKAVKSIFNDVETRVIRRVNM